ncbi:MAG: ABC transporter substrate-binding protein [Clostridiales bacterium]|nr:ABC transporter substrate-binding protein [Clostridiales bacterium]
MKRILSLTLVLCLAAVLFAVPAGAEATKTLNVAYMPNYASLWSVVTGIRAGFFEEEGLKINLVEFADGPTIIAAMENGSIDIGYIGPGAHRLAIQGRTKIFSFSQIGNADEVLGLKSHGVGKPEDLKGKKVGYASGTSSETILQYVLERANLTWEDIQAFEMDASALVTAASSGTLDAVAAWSPSTFTIKEQLKDDVVMLGNNVMFTDKAASVASWIVMPKYYEDNADTVLKFTRALYKAMDYQQDNVEETCKWVAEQVAQDFDVIFAQRGDADWPSSEEVVTMAKDGTLKAYYQTQQDAFLASGAVEEAVPVEDYVYFDNMIKAGE